MISVLKFWWTCTVPEREFVSRCRLEFTPKTGGIKGEGKKLGLVRVQQKVVEIKRWSVDCSHSLADLIHSLDTVIQ